MGLDGFTDLDTPDVSLGHIAVGFTGLQNLPVGELYGIVSGIDLANSEAVTVLVQLAGLGKQVIAKLQAA